MSESGTNNISAVASIPKQKLDRRIIHDILICEPITKKGIDALKNLNLEKKISKIDFIKNMIVEVNYLTSETNADPDSEPLYYQYTVKQKQADEIKQNDEDFKKRLSDDKDYEEPLLILGVAGNGKTIAIYRHIYETLDLNGLKDKRVAYIDLDEGQVISVHGCEFECEDNPYELFGLNVLEQIMDYLKKYDNEYTILKENHDQYFVKYNNTTTFYDKLFECIEKYNKDDRDTETEVFQCIIDEIRTCGGLAKFVRKLLEILIRIMFCADPKEMKYIYIDNIEEYIEVNNANIQIPDSDLKKIYRAINDATTIMRRFYKSMIDDCHDIKTFKIIVAMRRTSLSMLSPKKLHMITSENKTVNDVTGQVQLSDIWLLKKKDGIWRKYLKEQFDEESSKQIIDILDTLMTDGPKRTGVCYQSLIAPLMSYGLRRNARAQSYAVEQVYQYLLPSLQTTIDYDTFEDLLNKSENSEIRYMFRRALIEIQFKWAATPTQRYQDQMPSTRWKDLNMGHPGTEKVTSLFSAKIMENKIEYDDPNNLSLARRILSALRYDANKNISSEIRKSRQFNTIFPTISLYQLIMRVLDRPQHRSSIQNKEYEGLAKVLIALGDMANDETKSAPYVILNINDSSFRDDPSVVSLANLLKKIWEDGEESEIYKKKDYSIRITDAGMSFMLEWQYSFTLFAAINCYSCPPLFFLKDIATIKHIIKKVYDAAIYVCNHYHDETKRFCAPNMNVKNGTYMPIEDNEYDSFKTLVRKFHLSHLARYRSYIYNNYTLLGFSEYQRNQLLIFIDGYSSYYERNLMDGDIECF